MAARLRGHKQRKLNDMFIHFFCLCPLSLAIKLNFNISKVAYYYKPYNFIKRGMNKLKVAEVHYIPM